MQSDGKSACAFLPSDCFVRGPSVRFASKLLSARKYISAAGRGLQYVAHMPTPGQLELEDWNMKVVTRPPSKILCFINFKFQTLGCCGPILRRELELRLDELDRKLNIVVENMGIMIKRIRISSSDPTPPVEISSSAAPSTNQKQKKSAFSANERPKKSKK